MTSAIFPLIDSVPDFFFFCERQEKGTAVSKCG